MYLILVKCFSDFLSIVFILTLIKLFNDMSLNRYSLSVFLYGMTPNLWMEFDNGANDIETWI